MRSSEKKWMLFFHGRKLLLSCSYILQVVSQDVPIIALVGPAAGCLEPIASFKVVQVQGAYAK